MENSWTALDHIFLATPSANKDGTKIAFATNRDTSDLLECECERIYVMNADGTDQRKVSNGFAQDLRPVWSPDGTKIAYQSGTEALYHIWVINPDGSGARNLTPISQGYPIETHPDWSPDGRKILFVVGDDAQSEGDIWKMNSDGSHMQQLTKTPAVDLYPVWSPDGRRIVFSRDGDLFTMSPSGTRLQRITNTPLAREEDLDWQRIP